MNIGLIQSDIIPHNTGLNFRHYEKLIAESITQPVDLLLFPEMFACGFSNLLKEESETMDGKSISFLKNIAHQYHTEVVATLPIMENHRLYNRLIWLSDDKIMGQYDKRHLFMGDEQQFCTNGEKRILIHSHHHNFLPLTCFDVRFPIWSRNRLINNKLEYDCLIYLANFPTPRERILRTLCITRAIENQSFVLVVNRIGKDGNGHEHFGGTAVISPDGDILQAAGFNQEQILIQTLDFDKLSAFRSHFPVSRQWDDLSNYPF